MDVYTFRLATSTIMRLSINNLIFENLFLLSSLNMQRSVSSEKSWLTMKKAWIFLRKRSYFFGRKTWLCGFPNFYYSSMKFGITLKFLWQIRNSNRRWSCFTSVNQKNKTNFSIIHYSPARPNLARSMIAWPSWVDLDKNKFTICRKKHIRDFVV